MRVGIYGYGFLGKAMHRLFENTGHEIVIRDPEQGHLQPMDGIDLAIICVPTPPGPQGECNVSIVTKVVKTCPADLILIKSTVSPGTTDTLKRDTNKRIVFSPEYMGESKYFVPDRWLNPTDARKHGFMIVGGHEEDTADIIDIFLPILGPTCRFRQMEAKQAEIVKYIENSFFAVKVMFANEIRRICEASGVGYHPVREAWVDDPRTIRTTPLRFETSEGSAANVFRRTSVRWLTTVERSALRHF